MIFTYTATAFRCQSCSGKTHCAQCSEEAARTLRCSGAIEEVQVDLSQKRILVTGGDEDAILDALEDAGLLVG